MLSGIGPSYSRPVPSYANDPRHSRLVATLTPLLSRSCPADAGGYGGSYELRLTPEELEELGGLDLIHSAMREAAHSLGWSKVETYGAVASGLVGIVDRRDVPQQFAAAVQNHEMERQKAAAEAVAQALTSGQSRAVTGSVYLTTQEFRAAYAQTLGDG